MGTFQRLPTIFKFIKLIEHTAISLTLIFFLVCSLRDIRAGSFGHTLGASVGLSMVESVDGSPVSLKYLKEGNWDVEIAEKRWPCTVSVKPLYDPKNDKIKA